MLIATFYNLFGVRVGTFVISTCGLELFSINSRFKIKKTDSAKPVDWNAWPRRLRHRQVPLALYFCIL